MERFVIIDNGHGAETPGKCSPDGSLREWAWTRRLACRLAGRLAGVGIGSKLLVPGIEDIKLALRCQMVNRVAAENPGAVLISLHSNASAVSGWSRASGWSAFVAPGASEESRRLAAILFSYASAAKILGNRRTPPEGYNIGNFAICRDTVCPAVLTENMFHDNREDVEFMKSEAGMDTIVDIHAKAIAEYFDSRA